MQREQRSTPSKTPGASPHASTENRQAASAGRGVLLLTGSKIYFIGAGYAVQLLLPRLLGSPQAFGMYSAAMSLVSILNNVLIVATLQTVSRRVSEDPVLGDRRLREGLWMQLAVGTFFGANLLLWADRLASRVLLDPLLAPLFRMATVVVFSYALYAAFIGFLNGRQMFQRQALFDLTYVTLRTGGILGAAALGFGALGAIAGFASAAAAVLGLALLSVGLGRGGGAANCERAPNGWLRPWASLMAPLWVYHLCLNLTLQVDLTVLKRNAAALGLAAGQAPSAAAATASEYAGYYRAAQTFSFVPYQLVMSVALVVFPMVAQATALGDRAATRQYIRGALRFTMIVLFAVAAPVSGAAEGVMLIAYPEAYLAGSDALSVLSLGMAAFSLFVVAATTVSGAGQPGLSAMVAMLAVLCVIACNTAFVHHVGLGDRTLLAAACGTSVGTVLALCAMGTIVYLRFGTFVPLACALRVGVAAIVAFTVAHHLPHGERLSALVALVAGGVAYLASLGMLGEIGRPELAQLRRVLGK